MGVATVDQQGEELFEGKPASQLPLFEGFRLYRLEIALAGGTTMTLSEDANRQLKDALKLNAAVTITVTTADGQAFTLDAHVQQKTHKFKRNADTDTTETIELVRIAVDPDEG